MSSIIYPTTNFKATEQLFIERGEGIYVFDSQGKQYIEHVWPGAPHWVMATKK